MMMTMMMMVPYSDTAAIVFDINLRKCVYLQSVAQVFVRNYVILTVCSILTNRVDRRDTHRMRNNILHTSDDIIIIPLQLRDTINQFMVLL